MFDVFDRDILTVAPPKIRDSFDLDQGAAVLVGLETGNWRAIFAPRRRRWVLLLCATAFLLELRAHAAVFTQDFLQEDTALSATIASPMLVAAGLPGIPIMVRPGVCRTGSVAASYLRRCGAGHAHLRAASGRIYR